MVGIHSDSEADGWGGTSLRFGYAISYFEEPSTSVEFYEKAVSTSTLSRF